MTFQDICSHSLWSCNLKKSSVCKKNSRFVLSKLLKTGNPVCKAVSMLRGEERGGGESEINLLSQSVCEVSNKIKTLHLQVVITIYSK